MATGGWTWPRLTGAPTTYRCFWATAMGAFGRRETSWSGVRLCSLRWATSMAMGGWTWSCATAAPTTYRCWSTTRRSRGEHQQVTESLESHHAETKRRQLAVAHRHRGLD